MHSHKLRIAREKTYEESMKIPLTASALGVLLTSKNINPVLGLNSVKPNIRGAHSLHRTSHHDVLTVLSAMTNTDRDDSRIPGTRTRRSRLQSTTFSPKESLITATGSSADGNNSNSILEDSTGHINGELAERIFHWEQELRKERKLPQVDYSIRSGLRLVEESVEQVLSERGEDAAGQLYSDLVQEGLAALLDAMQHYREEENSIKSGEEAEGFARYAQAEIRQHLEKSLSRNMSNKPLRLPQSVVKMVNQAKVAAKNLATKEQKPTIEKVARNLGIPSAQLRDYLNLVKQLRPPTLSMESTMEITHPLLDETVSFQDFGEWEDDQHTNKDNNDAEEWMSEYYLDDPNVANLDGDDQAWIKEQSTSAGSLSDVIPDMDEPSPDDLALQEMIRHDVFEFLEGTLTKDEHAVIRSIFGLDSGKQSTLKRTATDLDMSAEHVSVLLAGGLQKLRESYTRKYVEPYLESETPGRTMDSV